MPATIYPTGSDDENAAAVAAAARAIHDGELVVMPTDTVYGIAADAFDPEAVQSLLDAKGRGRQMPPPVLIGGIASINALARDVPAYAEALVEAHWPGALTLVCRQQPSLQWDLGETKGTVAIRMPDHELARTLLDRTGPLAVSSANITGEPAARSAEEAEKMLGESVAMIIDGGPSVLGEASTIVDVTGELPRMLRLGALDFDTLDATLAPLGVEFAS
ncbi:MAG: L-threonylcarbamoyladenylate synthase [Nocardioides sp.]